MPPLARWFIKSALLNLVASLLVAVFLAVPRVGELSPALAALTPVYVHLFMVGWVTQMIFGVAYWMFPRYSAEAPRRSEALAVATYVTLNLGLGARAVAEPMLALRPGAAWSAVLIAAAALQWFAAVVFTVNTWARVKPR
jgi:hypothetical protein